MNQTVIVLPSAQERFAYYGDARWCCYAQTQIACWDTMIIHGSRGSTMGSTTEYALREAFQHLEIKTPYVGTLTRGAVHYDYFDPINGFLEYCGSMAYVKWPWRQVIEWLTKGWPRPTTTSVDTAPGLWCWHDHAIQILPEFDKNERAQLLKASVPAEVLDGHRLMTETEAVEVAIKCLNSQRVKPRNKPFRTCSR